MRRFSQRCHLVTLSEINITPLLDLAFVLLIIFVITTPLLEQGVPLQLPTGGQPDRPIDPRDRRTVEITSQGVYYLDRTRVSLDELERRLVAANRADPNTIVSVRADEDAKTKYLAEVLDRCARNGITRFSYRFFPPGREP